MHAKKIFNLLDDKESMIWQGGQSTEDSDEKCTYYLPGNIFSDDIKDISTPVSLNSGTMAIKGHNVFEKSNHDISGRKSVNVNIPQGCRDTTGVNIGCRDTDGRPSVNVETTKVINRGAIMTGNHVKNPTDRIYNELPGHITSYGTVCYCIYKGKILYMSGKARDSIPYREFIKGRLQFDDIPRYISLMTVTEIERLKKYYESPSSRNIKRKISKHYFDDLWDDLWINKNTTIFIKEYPVSKIKFIKNMAIFKSCFDNYNSGLDNPRIFTKGRLKSSNEDKKIGAIRETSEESGISKNIIQIDPESTPLCEQYIGNDGQKYQTKYFLAKLPYIPKLKYIYQTGLRNQCISSEISDIYWEDYSTLLKKLDESKKKILTIFNQYIVKTNNKIIIPIMKRRWTI